MWYMIFQIIFLLLSLLKGGIMLLDILCNYFEMMTNVKDHYHNMVPVMEYLINNTVCTPSSNTMFYFNQGIISDMKAVLRPLPSKECISMLQNYEMWNGYYYAHRMLEDAANFGYIDPIKNMFDLIEFKEYIL